MRYGAIAAVILLITGIVTCGCMGTSQDTGKSKDIVIGALVPLTGDWSAKSQNINTAIDLAVQDTNANLASAGSSTRVRLLGEDTGTDPEIALQKIKKLHEAGVRIVVGPASSAEIARVKDWADQNNMVILGYSSTAPSLSIAGDNVFRMVPDDTRQGEAMAAYLNKSGTRVIIPVVRNDIWGTNLLSATKTRFERTGGIVSEPYLYEPGTRDFTKVVPNLSARVAAAQHQYGNTTVGVYVICLDEIVPLLSSASDYSPLASVKWFGSDGTAKVDVLIKNASAARFAAGTGFYNPLYGAEEESAGAMEVKDRIRAITGSEPDAYSLAAYDAAAIAARSLIISDDATYEQLKNSVELTAGYYHGITGWTKFVQSGDRAYAVYHFWTVSMNNGTATWEQVARYQSDPNQKGGFT